MIANIGSEPLDDAFKRVRDLDVSLQEQLRTFAETVRARTAGICRRGGRLVSPASSVWRRRVGAANRRAMPPFVLPDETGQMVSLEELLNRGPVAVTFHRGHWCPDCRINIKALVGAQRTCLPAQARSSPSCLTGRNSSRSSNCSRMCRFPSSRTWITDMPLPQSRPSGSAPRYRR